MLDYSDVTLTEIRNGDFPCHHDYILSCHFYEGVGLRYQYFTCPYSMTSVLKDLLSKLYFVMYVKVISVDNFNK